jgi:hypothetical protein
MQAHSLSSQAARSWFTYPGRQPVLLTMAFALQATAKNQSNTFVLCDDLQRPLCGQQWGDA